MSSVDDHPNDEEENATTLLGIFLGLTLIGVTTLVLVANAYFPDEQHSPRPVEQVSSMYL